MTLWLLLLALAQGECRHGGSGAQCVTCVPSDRGTIVCRGVCYVVDPKAPRPDGGYSSRPLKGEDKTESGARQKVEQQAKEKCK